MQKIRQLASETALYGLGSLVPRFLNFLLFPIQTRFFEAGEYGLINYLYIYVAFLNIVYTFGMETAYFRFASKSGADESRVFRTAQTFVVSISLIISCLIIAFSQPLSHQLDADGQAHIIIWLAIILFVDNIVAIPFARLRYQKKGLYYASARIINAVLLIGLNFLFLFVLEDIKSEDFSGSLYTAAHTLESISGIAWVFLANLIANLFYLFFFFRTLIRWRPQFDKSIFSGMFQYAYPVMLMGLSGMLNEMFSRWALEWWLPPGFYAEGDWHYALGIFSASYKYAVFMAIAIQAFRYAADPFFFSQASDKNSPALFAKVNHYFIIVCAFILLSVTINMDILKLLMGRDEYYQGIAVVPILLFSYLLFGVYFNFSIWYKITDRTYYGTLLTVVGTVITIAANYYLIPRYGYLGSSWASVACYSVMTVGCYLLGQRYFPVPYRLLPAAGYLLLAFVFVYGSNRVTFTSQVLATSFHVFMMAAFAGIVWLLERKNLRATES